MPVCKKDETLWFCDYRWLNDVTKKDAYPFPRIKDVLDSLVHARWFSILDLAGEYKTTFITLQVLFEFNVLGFGLCNAPIGTFQRFMDSLLVDLQWITCLVYLDDRLLLFLGGHLGNIYNGWMSSSVNYTTLIWKLSCLNVHCLPLRFIIWDVISADGERADPAKIDVVRQWPVPKNLRWKVLWV